MVYDGTLQVLEISWIWFLVRRGHKSVRSWWGYDSALLARQGQTSLQGKQTRQTSTPLSSLVRVYHQLGSADEQNYSVDSYLDCVDIIYPVKIQVLFLGSPFFLPLRTIRFPEVETWSIPCKLCEVKSVDAPTVVGKAVAGYDTWAFSSQWRNERQRGDLLHGSV